MYEHFRHNINQLVVQEEGSVNWVVSSESPPNILMLVRGWGIMVIMLIRGCK